MILKLYNWICIILSDIKKSAISMVAVSLFMLNIHSQYLHSTFMLLNLQQAVKLAHCLLQLDRLIDGESFR